jgi:hypothetical protein
MSGPPGQKSTAAASNARDCSVVSDGVDVEPHAHVDADRHDRTIQAGDVRRD